MNILDAAESAGSCSHMTILIGHDGTLHLIADSDWPLDSLTRHHGAKTAYRVSESSGSVRVEGREGQRTCVMESAKPARIARLLLGKTSVLPNPDREGGDSADTR
jgi:hypothetical protein